MAAGKFKYQTAFVVNPNGGKGRSLRVWKYLESVLQDRKEKYEVYFTNGIGDGVTQAAKAGRDGAELIVAVGGDGTIKEVVNGMDLEKNILGIISAGTGNGYRRALDIPHNAELCLRGLSEWPVVKTDVPLVNGRIFVNTCGAGFDALMSRTAMDDDYWLKGYPAYVAAYFQHLNFKPRPVTYRLNGGESVKTEAVLVVVANGKFYGGQVCVAPKARIDDGLLDFQFMGAVGAGRKMFLSGMSFFRTYAGLVKIHQVKTIELDAEGDMPLHIDGETKEVDSFPLKFSVQERALQVLSPKKQSRFGKQKK